MEGGAPAQAGCLATDEDFDPRLEEVERPGASRGAEDLGSAQGGVRSAEARDGGRPDEVEAEDVRRLIKGM